MAHRGCSLGHWPHAGQQSAHMGLGPITRCSQSWESPGDAGADVNPSLNTLAGV